MSFRLKIGLSFCCILFLTITIAIASWWGMNAAVQRQNTFFSLSLEIDRQFNSMALEEHSYSSSKKIGYAHAVNKIIDELTFTIGEMNKKASRSQQQQVEKILAQLTRYRDNSTNFTKQVAEMMNMQSRMLHESDRLLSNTRTLSDQESDISANILLQTNRMLQSAMIYMLTGTKISAAKVTTLTADIKTLADQIMDQADESSLRLRAYRISKVASVYGEIFNRYLAERDNLQQMIQFMHHSQQELASELRTFVDKELALSQSQVNRLQLFALAVSLFAVILSVVITIFLSDRITRPLEQLKNSAQEILNGNLDTLVTLNSRDEIGQLGVIFNQMTLKLRQSFNDVLSYRNHLEELVDERTLDLVKEVDERTAIEQALRSSEERLQTIVDQSPMGIILWNTDFQVSQWNPAAEKIFGYSPEEAIGLPVDRLLPESMHPHIEKIWQKLTATYDGIRSHNQNINKDGRIILCDWFNTPVYNSAGDIQGALSLVEDVTERMRTEKELLKIEKLESTGILAGGIAHDFNNILTAILGNINLSLFDENLSPKTRNLLGSAEKATLRAKDLTQQLLTFAKGGEPIRESTSLAEIIEDSATFVLHGSNVTCTYQLPDDLWYAVVDKGQISQVIQNIVLNSRHAMPKGGKITIVCENVLPVDDPFSLLDSENVYVKISIRDNGIGIDADMLDKIFDPYFSTKQEGSGLGLAITHSIINKHHGHILVNSEQGKGTEFIIFLPATPESAGQKTIRRDVTATIQPLKILVMDDNKEVQAILEAMLTKIGHSVALASEGREAIKLYQDSRDSEEPFDLVIFDLTIPGGLGGKETLVELRKIDPQIRAIVSSGYSNDPVMASFKKYGFSAAVNKPYILKELSEAIELAHRKQ